MRHSPLLAACLALTLAACHTPATGVTVTREHPPIAVKTLALAHLVGTVHFLSSTGGAIISNNSGSVVSNHGASLISNNGGALVSDSGSARRLLQLSTGEALLADAKVTVMDAAGKPVTGADGKPIVAVTDAKGAFHFDAPLPEQGLVLEVTLFPNGVAAGAGGTLCALLAHGHGGAVTTVDLDTATTLAGRYVLERLVKQRQNVLDRLTPDATTDLRKTLTDARKLLGTTVPSYQATDMAALTADLRSNSTGLDASLQRVEALLLAGLPDLGNGSAATSVALAGPRAIVGDGKGGIYVLETLGRIRQITASGSIFNIVATPQLECTALVQAADGSIYVEARSKDRILKLLPDHSLVPVVGSGTRAQGSLDGDPAQLSLFAPAGLAAMGNGLAIGEAPREFLNPGRLLSWDGAGAVSLLHPVDTLADRFPADITAMTSGPDGTLYVLDTVACVLAIRSPDGAWRQLHDPDWFIGGQSALLVGPDGHLFLSCGPKNKVVDLVDGSQRNVVAGNGEASGAGDGGPALSASFDVPSGMYFAPNNQLYVTEYDGGRVRAIDWKNPSHPIRTLAGNGTASRVGDALGVSLDVPGSMVLDQQGRLTIAEVAGGAVKRLVNGELSVVAGGGASVGDGLATDCRLIRPTGLVTHGTDLYIADAEDFRVRKVDGSGQLTTVAGNGHQEPDGGSFVDGQLAAGPCIRSLGGLAYDETRGIVWADIEAHRIFGLQDGKAVRIAGMEKGNLADWPGDGVAANQAPLQVPTGLATGPNGVLYYADTYDASLRAIDRDGTVRTVAGLGLGKTIEAIGNNDLPASGKATEMALLMPMNFCVAKDGTIYLCELGTANVDVFKAMVGSGATGGVIEIVSKLPKLPAHVRKITPDGTMTTIAGQGSAHLAATEGSQALLAPLGIALDAEGGLIIADAAQAQLFRLAPGTF